MFLVGKMLSLLGGTVIGYGRRPLLDPTPENSFISEYYNCSKLSQFLSKCDYIINVLPSTPETDGLLNGNVLEICKGANNYNLL